MTTSTEQAAYSVQNDQHKQLVCYEDKQNPTEDGTFPLRRFQQTKNYIILQYKKTGEKVVFTSTGRNWLDSRDRQRLTTEAMKAELIRMIGAVETQAVLGEAGVYE